MSKVEEKPETTKTQEVRYTAPAIPAYTALLYHICKYWFTPYWVIMFFIYLCKDYLLYKGVAPLDWVFLFLWIPIQIIAIYFGIRMFRLPVASFFWPWLISSIVAVFFELFFFIIAQTVLYFEYIITIIILITQIILLLAGFVSFFIQRRPMRIQPE